MTDTDTERTKPLLTITEVAALLRRSSRTIRRYASVGVLCPVRIGGGRPLYRARDVFALIEGAKS